MKRLPELAILLTVTFSLAACGGGEARQSGQGDSSDEQRAAPATQSAATNEANPDAPTEETAAEDEAAQGERSGESAGTSVTTLDGEQISIGGGGDATALFFMAGW